MTYNTYGTSSNPILVYDDTQLGATKVGRVVGTDAASGAIVMSALPRGSTASATYFQLAEGVTVSTPIGTGADDAFIGVLDGNTKTVTLAIPSANVKAAANGAYYAGLFGYIASGATVKNLALEGSVNVSVAKDLRIGALVGQSDGTIQNIASSVSVTGTTNVTNIATYAGGIAGVLTAGTVKDSYSTGIVSASSRWSPNAGGIVGDVYNASVTRCWASGAISTSNGSQGSAGGIVGLAEAPCTITDCFALNPTITCSADTQGSSATFNYAGCIWGAGSPTGTRNGSKYPATVNGKSEANAGGNSSSKNGMAYPTANFDKAGGGGVWAYTWDTSSTWSIGTTGSASAPWIWAASAATVGGSSLTVPVLWWQSAVTTPAP
jgi:hypothetical protein